jgi:tRNA(Ile)-lysidine synthase
VDGPLQAGLEACAGRLDPASPAPLAVAFSGGGDSLALLRVALAWAGGFGREVLALHVDHGLQARSGAWAELARLQALSLDAQFRLLRWEGPKPATGLPAAARAARHRLIAEAARQAGCKVVLVGHTLDDQWENAVMRSAGVPIGDLREWGPSPAWPQGRGLFLLRPLLGLRRAVLREWLAQEGLAWIDDPANDDLRYARPQARKAVHEGCRCAAAPAPDLGELIGACVATGWGGFRIDRRRLLDSPFDSARRLLQLAAVCASGVQILPRPGQAAKLLDRLRSGEEVAAVLAGARLEAGDPVQALREAGESVRGGLASLPLEPAVRDGRFEIRVAEPGWRVEPLKGHAARLQRRDAARLREFPASVRPSLPVLRALDGAVAPVCLALLGERDHIEVVGGFLRALGEDRFAAAAGFVTKEVEIGTNARIANVPRPSYVG